MSRLQAELPVVAAEDAEESEEGMSALQGGAGWLAPPIKACWLLAARRCSTRGASEAARLSAAVPRGAWGGVSSRCVRAFPLGRPAQLGDCCCCCCCGGSSGWAPEVRRPTWDDAACCLGDAPLLVACSHRLAAAARAAVAAAALAEADIRVGEAPAHAGPRSLLPRPSLLPPDSLPVSAASFPFLSHLGDMSACAFQEGKSMQHAGVGGMLGERRARGCEMRPSNSSAAPTRLEHGLRWVSRLQRASGPSSLLSSARHAASAALGIEKMCGGPAPASRANRVSDPSVLPRSPRKRW